MNNSNPSSNEDEFDIKKEFFKYFFYWRWFASSIFICILFSLIFLRYSSSIFSTTAKIKILDKKENSLELPTANQLFKSNKINLENEIELLSSYTIMSNVVDKLKLNTSFYVVGDIKTSRLANFPFDFEQLILTASIKEKLIFNIVFDAKDRMEIEDVMNDTIYVFNSLSTYKNAHNLPFNINLNKSSILLNENENYRVVFSNIRSAVNLLKKDLLISHVGKESDILQLKIENENSDYSEMILNKLIDIFNKDGVSDRQMIHKRTIDFVNERYLLLANELDSIEIEKQLYKFQNNLIDISANSSLSLTLKSKSNQQLIDLENQISITKLLATSLKDDKSDLLPANIGIANIEINSLISDFNAQIFDRNNLIISAGSNNPSVLQLNSVIDDLLSNIKISVDNFLNQLNQTKRQLLLQSEKFNKDVSSLPKKEKFLRSIERNQIIKESLYLFLLQKREEAQVSFAVTEPTIKIIENALSSEKPITPNKNIIFLGACLLGLLIPFIIIYLIFLLNTKIHLKEDIIGLNLGADVIGEIPLVTEDNVIFDDPAQRSVLAESFRMLSSNLKYMLPNSKDCSIIISTSTIKGEGKTFTAVNTSLALSSLGKKVLLIGCDLRNPQLHKYLGLDKSINGLVNYLFDGTVNWKDSLLKCFPNHPTHDILLSGVLPPNPVQLLNNGNLEKLLDDAKKDYDYIILDTAPTILVTDTITIAHHADAILYVSRANLTEKEVLSFPKELISSGKIKNVGFILNGLGAQNKYGYSYGYQYGYGYKYSYNYGYGYGYEEDKDKSN